MQEDKRKRESEERQHYASMGQHPPPRTGGTKYPVRYLWGKFLGDMGWLSREVLNAQPDDWVYERWGVYQLENDPACELIPPYYD